MRKFLFIGFLSVFLSSCAAHYGAATIKSNPPGAEVVSTDDGTILGVTPMTYWWKEPSGNTQYKVLRIKKEGYYEKSAPFKLSMRHNSEEEAKENATIVEVNLQQIGQ